MVNRVNAETLPRGQHLMGKPGLLGQWLYSCYESAINGGEQVYWVNGHSLARDQRATADSRSIGPMPKFLLRVQHSTGEKSFIELKAVIWIVCHQTRNTRSIELMALV